MTFESAFDEQLVARIVAAAESSDVHVTHGREAVFRDMGSDKLTLDGACVCAVGAGALYAGMRPLFKHHHSMSAYEIFALVHGVSVSYAEGVSDGYECGTGNDIYSSHHRTGARADDYDRGVCVGEAVRAYFEDS